MAHNLAKDWFGPDGTLYAKRDNPHSFPASWELPKSAKEVPAEPVAPAEKPVSKK